MPRRWAPTLDITALLLGAMNIPSPKPIIATRTSTLQTGVSAPIREMRSRATATTVSPVEAMARAP